MKNPARILYVEMCEDHTVGGSHQALFDLVVGLDRTVFEPVVLFYQDNRFRIALEEQGVEVHVLEARAKELEVRATKGKIARVADSLAAVFRRAKLLKDLRIDLLHINNSPLIASDDWLPASKFSGIPCVSSVMGAGSEESHVVRRFLMKRFDRVITISQHVTGQILAQGFPPERVTEVCLGVDIEAIQRKADQDRQSVRTSVGVGEGRMFVAMVGNIRQWKGQQVVLDAVSLMEPSARDRLCIAFIGAVTAEDRGYDEDLKEQVATEGWSESVLFLGTRVDVPSLFKAADLALHASTHPEPFGLVVIEAMAVGTPVLAANKGGPAQIVTPESGITYDVTNPQELADLLTELSSDPARLERLGEGASSRAEEFSIAHNVAGTVDVYNEILSPV